MEISKGMQEAIARKDLTGIYSSFYTILMYDPGFVTGQFDETLRYVKSLNISGFMKPYNGKPFKPESEWTADYYDIVASQLMDNFCQERIDFLHRAGKKLYPQMRKSSSAENAGQSRQNNNTTQHRRSTSINRSNDNQKENFSRRSEEAKKKSHESAKAKNKSFFDVVGGWIVNILNVFMRGGQGR